MKRALCLPRSLAVPCGHRRQLMISHRKRPAQWATLANAGYQTARTISRRSAAIPQWLPGTPGPAGTPVARRHDAAKPIWHKAGSRFWRWPSSDRNGDQDDPREIILTRSTMPAVRPTISISLCTRPSDACSGPVGSARIHSGRAVGCRDGWPSVEGRPPATPARSIQTQQHVSVDDTVADD